MITFPSLTHVALASIAALAFGLGVGYPVMQRFVPGLPSSLGMLLAPAGGLAVYAIVSLPIFLWLPFTRFTILPVMALALGGSWWLGRRAAGVNPDTGLKPSVWLLLGTAMLAALAAAAVFPQIVNDSVGLGGPIFDHFKVAIVDQIWRGGVPPLNPFFTQEGSSNHLIYYYLWYFLAAQLKVIPRLSGWEADIALTYVTAFSSLLVMIALAFWLSKRRSSGWWVLILSLSASLRPVVNFISKGALNQVLVEEHGLEAWLPQAAWVPQHLFSATTVVLSLAGILLLCREKNRNLPLACLVGVLVAAGYGCSTWVGGVTFLVTAAAITSACVWCRSSREEIGRLAMHLGVAGLVAVVFSAPFILQQLAVFGRGSAPFRPGLLHVFKASSGGRSFLGDFVGYWVFYLLIEYPVIYPVGVLGMITYATAGSRPRRAETAFQLFCAAAASLLVAQLLHSTIANNDLGWRAVLPAMLLLTAFAAGFLAERFHPCVPGSRSRLALVPFGLLVLLGCLSGLGFAKHVDADLYFSRHPRPYQRAFYQVPEVWDAVRRHTPPDEAVLSNPLYFAKMTPWPANISWALFSDRKACISSWEPMRAHALNIDSARLDELLESVSELFDGTVDVSMLRALRDVHGCRTLLVVPGDRLWSTDGIVETGLFRLVEEVPGKWKIYRARK